MQKRITITALHMVLACAAPLKSEDSNTSAWANTSSRPPRVQRARRFRTGSVFGSNPTASDAAPRCYCG